MKKVLFIIKHSAGYFEVWANKRFIKRMKNLGRCVIFIAQYIVDARIENYEIYAFNRGRQVLIKEFNAELIYDFAKDKKDSIISFGDYNEDDEDNNDFDYLDDEDNDFENRRFSRNEFQSRKSIGYHYTPKDNSHNLEVLKDNLKNILG